MRRYLMEFIGTLFLVLTIGLVVVNPNIGPLAPLAIGGILIPLVYMGYHVSGAHYNPAVTIAVMLRGQCEFKVAIFYIIIQLLAAVGAAILTDIIKPITFVHIIQMDMTRAFFAEVVFTFALVFVILNVATVKKTAGNSYYGLAIGLTVMAGVFVVGGISGAVFNPAVALGITLLGVTPLSFLFMYIFSSLIAAVLATMAFKITNPQE